LDWGLDENQMSGGMIGQAAGVAAALAVRGHSPVQDVSISALQKKLHEHGAVLHLSEEFSAK
jgi:hypothetical protein